MGWVLDVGASIGNHTVYWAAKCGYKVTAFEPDWSRYMDLVRNIAQNSVKVRRCRLALSDRDRTGILTSASEWRDDSVGPLSAFPFDGIPHIVDDPVSMVKVDVEGHEPQVLAGMLQTLDRDGPDLYVESHSEQARADVFSVIEPLGYELVGEFKMGSRMDWWKRP